MKKLLESCKGTIDEDARKRPNAWGGEYKDGEAPPEREELLRKSGEDRRLF